MKLIQITGTHGGDTLLVVVPDHYHASEIQEALESLGKREIDLRGPAVREVEITLPEALEVDHYSVFRLIG